MQTKIELKYQTFATPKGNKYEIHSTHSGEELAKNKPIANFLVDKFGGRMQLLPNQIQDIEIYNKIMPFGVKVGKFPDAYWKNEIWEFKTNNTGKLSSVDIEIKKGYKQANKILIRFDYVISTKELFRLAKGRLNSFSLLESIWFWVNGKIIRFEKKNIFKKIPRKF